MIDRENLPTLTGLGRFEAFIDRNTSNVAPFVFHVWGLWSIWTLGDFAYSKILLQGSKTIGLLVAEFWEVIDGRGQCCVLHIVDFCISAILVILGVGVVTDRKFKSHL